MFVWLVLTRNVLLYLNGKKMKEKERKIEKATAINIVSACRDAWVIILSLKISGILQGFFRDSWSLNMEENNFCS